ncbi:hypothetical protein B0T24DRAFT_27593 [Lasiosphaeria ovina]|uniref:Secreted protein n=1 Tax=Lasiosphaeria ovina TaxID=92902 RepID=A0AAE0TXB1_9PEZI|nr:hypothetical protein B0T24DRAFT_27593 [Lasiosphaeria ovina]
MRCDARQIGPSCLLCFACLSVCLSLLLFSPSRQIPDPKHGGGDNRGELAKGLRKAGQVNNSEYQIKSRPILPRKAEEKEEETKIIK